MNNGGCGSATFFTCTNNVGAGPTCADINECLTNNGGCGSPTQYTCVNNVGAGPTCADIREPVIGCSASADEGASILSLGSLAQAGQSPFNGWYGKSEGVSSDGNVVVGYAFIRNDPSMNAITHPFRWTKQGGLEDLLASDSLTTGVAWGTNCDGTVVVGYDADGAFRWTSSGGLVHLGEGIAFAVSADGSTIVGTQGDLPVLWQGSSPAVRVGTEGNQGRAFGVSADGKVVVGWQLEQAYVWSAAAGKVFFGDLSTSGRDVSADGRFAVAYHYNGGAFRWSAALGVQNIATGGVRAHD